MTSNLARRLKEHNSSGTKGAKYLRAKKPVDLIYSEKFPTIQSAMIRECEVKKWTKTKKEELVSNNMQITRVSITIS